MIHVDYAPVPGCKCPEDTYGMICVKCNKCGRFNERVCTACNYWLAKANRCKLYRKRKTPCDKFSLKVNQ